LELNQSPDCGCASESLVLLRATAMLQLTTGVPILQEKTSALLRITPDGDTYIDVLLRLWPLHLSPCVGFGEASLSVGLIGLRPTQEGPIAGIQGSW
jgi:hypothetical protein